MSAHLWYIATAQANLDAINADKANLEKRQAQLQDQTRILETQKDIAEENAKTAEQESVNNEARLRQLPGDINQAGKVQGEEDKGAAAVEMLSTHMQGTSKTLADYGLAAGESAKQMHAIVDGMLNHTLTLVQVQNKLAQKI